MNTSDTSASHAPFSKAELTDQMPQLRAFARSLIRNHDRADDLVQEAVLKAWAKRHQFTPGTNLRAWLFTILRNHFHSQARKAAREIEDVDGVHAGRIAVGPAQEDAVQMTRLKAAMAELSDDHREALVLVGAAGFTYEHAAEVCGCAVGTMKSRVNRARVRLAELMGIEDRHDLAMGTAAVDAVLSVSPTTV